MARLIIKEPSRKREERKEYFVRDEAHDFHTEEGSIPKDVLAKGGTFRIGKHVFRILPASFKDFHERLERGPQIITPKDLGLIIAETGLTKESVVLDIGFGSGAVTGYLSRVAKHVYAYDVSKENVTQGLQNLEALDTPAAYTVKVGDAYDKKTIGEKDVVDVFVLDVPEPWRSLPVGKQALKVGAWLVAYTPCITQAMNFVEALDDSWLHVKTCEVIEREWKVAGKAVRPVTKDFGHTAFLTFVRKLS